MLNSLLLSNDNSMLQYYCGNFTRLFLISKSKRKEPEYCNTKSPETAVEMSQRLLNNFNSDSEMGPCVSLLYRQRESYRVYPCVRQQEYPLRVYRDIHVISFGCFALATL